MASASRTTWRVAPRGSGASHASDGKPPAKGRVQARSRTSPALCPCPAAAVSRAVDPGARSARLFAQRARSVKPRATSQAR